MKPGASVQLTGVAWRQHGPALTLSVPGGQTVALHTDPRGDGGELIDVVAGLRRVQSGQLTVGDVAVDSLSGPALHRYTAERGVLSARFGVRSSLSGVENVLDGADGLTRPQAIELLTVTGVTHMDETAETLSDEQKWRIMLARALRTRPRLVLAETPALALEPRAATGVLDLLTDLQAKAGFTLLLTIGRLAMASYCQRLVRLVDGLVVEDMLIGDDPLVRGRVDRIG